MSLLSLLFMIEIPTFALLFQNFEPYFIPTFLMEGPWKPALVLSVLLKKILKQLLLASYAVIKRNLM